MSVDDSLFDASWSEDAKNWARLQLGHLKKDSQKEMIDQIAAKFHVEELKGPFDNAFKLKLPAPGLPYTEVAEYAAPVRNSLWIILIRYSSDDPIAMHPRLASQQANAEIGPLQRGKPLKDLLHLADWMRKNLKNGGHAAPAALENFVEEVMAVSRQELQPKPGGGQTIRPYNPNDQDSGILPSFRRLEYHQTGLQKGDDL